MKVIYKPLLIIIVLSTFLSIGLIICSQITVSKYYETHSFFYDPVTSYSKGIAFYQRMLEESSQNQIASRLNFAILELKANPRTPFFNIPIILLYPKLLASPWSIAPVACFMVCIFLIIFGYSLHIRSFKFTEVITAILLAVSAPILFDYFRGISSGWHDLPTSYLFAAGIISLINWFHYRNFNWILISVLLVSLATISRSIFAVYAIMAYLPLFIIFSVSFLKEETGNGKWLKFFSLFFIVFVISGIYHLIHFQSNYYYYTHNSLTGKVPSIIDSLLSFMKLFGTIGVSFVILFLLIFKYFRSISVINKTNLFLIIYPVLIFPLFWIFYYQMGKSAYHVMITIMPYLFILFLVFERKSSSSKMERYIPIVFLILLISLMPTNFLLALNKSKENNKLSRDTKKLDQLLAKEAIKLNSNDHWVAYFDEQYTQIVNCEGYHSYKAFINPHIQFEQFVHKEYLDSKYPFWAIIDIIEHQKKKLEKIKLFVIFADENSMKKAIPIGFKESRKITAELMNYLKNNKEWQCYKKIRTLKYGNLALFRKKR